MLITSNIEQAAMACAKGEEVTFFVNETNQRSLFTFCYYQLKHKTTNEFETIIWKRKKNLLYYFLRLASQLSFGKYKLIYKG